MGCDIHLYIEKKNKDGKWEKLIIDECLLPDDRNYSVFGFLAGVRGDYKKPLFPKRGFPDDSSIPKDETEHFLGDHSFTHAYLDEILEANWDQLAYDIDDDYKFSESYFYVFCEYVLPRLCSSCRFMSLEEKRNVRIIMGFDS